MARTFDPIPPGTQAIAGLRHRRSAVSVSSTIERLRLAIDQAGARVFDVIDHSGEASRVGLSLRETQVVIFGNPRAGTPMMVASPLLALDLPMKVLVWADDAGATWMTYADPAWLGERYGLSPEMARPLGAVARITESVAAA